MFIVDKIFNQFGVIVVFINHLFYNIIIKSWNLIHAVDAGIGRQFGNVKDMLIISCTYLLERNAFPRVDIKYTFDKFSCVITDMVGQFLLSIAYHVL